MEKDPFFRQSLSDPKLFEMASDFQGEYFTDFTLQDFPDDFDCQGTWELPTLFPSNTLCWIFKYFPDKNTTEGQILGTIDYENREIRINETLKGKPILKHILLHEMIHAYEDCLFDGIRKNYAYIIQCRDYLLIKLVQKIKDKRLIERVLFEARQMDAANIRHTPFFALKALDLELRLRLKHGTLMGYGRDQY
ncbi:MAG: hypothetical protein A2268_00980 [Candidatus Raymondbacteria bacterium RifOxyA12_full_50_37]|uniref:Uncharacterized protein n=1 Tax=Candidatus Raymondbacteria bacterium RIFOXYD12_FULL_49_13 TaxID=1817890 RepID=A0A1F7FFX9_UNCRA|nr:MAG: hypothetical protein A2268_00980 [Candidatus Raymondbacteria bacterium RifOxyA12_full_50_37]OGJ86377.1 MAG: hypothetical protein A2248_13945 [Candidatus Raymondbacteria bacterium RIFOXYA2_FULL_49_16]OGJ95547.1 MAG: hypothetical protein A2453_12720 [Candidatus Raymondbacteria bacterium RIFOXYC2_FULL_50_21]OGJ99444.1 MAG: hypothetical protein A2487_07475 [Candidatus Raymondbacteria bacterium RifOxyC12_full_50_8]OGK04528.1 MAG: hypothetical protein A2350_18030 [Candidatus Raymondbacteria b